MAGNELSLGDPPVAPRARVSPRIVRSLRGSRPLTALVHALVVCVFVLLVTFLLVRAVPGDPVLAIVGNRATPQVEAALRREFGLDKPLPAQLADYLGQVFRGNFGHSIAQGGEPVGRILADSLPITLSLVAVSIVISVVLGVLLGLAAGLAGGAVDVAVRVGAVVFLALPPFFLGLLLITVVSDDFGLLPPGGWGGAWYHDLRFVLLPALALSGFLTPIITRSTRQAARQAQQELWYEAGIARGVSPVRLAVRHVVPNSLLPVITLVGYNAGALIAGAVVVEAVFGLPGVGQQLVDAINARDYPVIQGIALVSALIVVGCNLVADLGYIVADPRARG